LLQARQKDVEGVHPCPHFRIRYGTKGTSEKSPDKKGKVEEALRGVENVLLIAHQSRNLSVILPIPEEDEEGNVLLLPNNEAPNDSDTVSITTSPPSDIIR